jgi:hypothetical protein
MARPLFSNHASSLLQAGILAGATSLTIAAADADKFPAPTGGDWFPVVAVDVLGEIEVMRCTARSGDTLTVTRAQEGTSARAFTAGAKVALRLTAGALDAALDLKAAAADLTSHTSNTANPHAVTKSQVGLANVDNTSDLAKPISTATQSALATKFPKDGSESMTGDLDLDSHNLLDVGQINGRDVSAIQSRMGTLTDVANGATIPATDGILANMQGATCYLPDTTGLPTGFTVYLYAPGGYASHLQFWVAAQAGQNIYSHNVNKLEQTFYLAPREVLKFTLSSVGYWIWEVVQQASRVMLAKTGTTAGWVAMGTSWNWSSQPATPVFGPEETTTGGALYLPFHGRYAVGGQAYVSYNTAPNLRYLAVLNSNWLTPTAQNFTFGTGTNFVLRVDYVDTLKSGDWVQIQTTAHDSDQVYYGTNTWLWAAFLGR